MASDQLIKAIPAKYAGIEFRSRLEARWAMFLDLIGVKYFYEYEGYQLPSGWYLPDFFLPGIWNHGAFLEIKPVEPSDSERQSLIELVGATQKPALFISGLSLDPIRGFVESDGGCWMMSDGSPYIGEYVWGECPECHSFRLTGASWPCERCWSAREHNIPEDASMEQADEAIDRFHVAVSMEVNPGRVREAFKTCSTHKFW